MEMLEEVDIEEFAKVGRPVPVAKRYRIRIDKESRTTENPTPTGREILSLVNKTPEQFILAEKVRGGQPKIIAAEERVDLRAPGIERFMTTPRDSTEGVCAA